MAGKSKSATEVASKKQAALPTEQKIARLLGFLVVKDVEDTADKALMLLAAGFDATEIGEMLGVNKNYAHTAAYRKKQSVGKK